MSGLVVVLSGGLDSAVLLWHLRARGAAARAITVRYGQRHVCEVGCAMRLASAAGVPHDVVDLSDVGAVLPGSALTDGAVAVPQGHYEDASMRATVVPNRNMLLLSVALGVAAARGLAGVAYGAHAGDHAIYPDCRREFVERMQAVARVCHFEPLRIEAPFTAWSKAEIVWRGRELGVPFGLTWTCYEGRARHCGRCGSCTERREAFERARCTDPTEYEA